MFLALKDMVGGMLESTLFNRFFRIHSDFSLFKELFWLRSKTIRQVLAKGI